uniref:Uncharacterized protein n=1 Tax=viral metagenome TaxID=1070528 RepID=A0A6C0B001_9ZZZZ|tara:strand:- start:2150 stop:2494 length:345 start_codon:yes stop_codon:yes gene_type:complete
MINILNFLQKFSNITWHQKLYIYGSLISSILFFISIMGITYVDSKYLTSLHTILKIYVAFILLIHFNPFIEYKKSQSQQNFDRKIAFSAGVFLLLTTTIVSSIESYIRATHKYI